MQTIERYRTSRLITELAALQMHFIKLKKSSLLNDTGLGLTKTFLKNVKSIWLSHCGMKFRGLMQKITLPISLL